MRATGTAERERGRVYVRATLARAARKIIQSNGAPTERNRLRADRASEIARSTAERERGETRGERKRRAEANINIRTEMCGRDWDSVFGGAGARLCA